MIRFGINKLFAIRYIGYPCSIAPYIYSFVTLLLFSTCEVRKWTWKVVTGRKAQAKVFTVCQWHWCKCSWIGSELRAFTMSFHE